jgi:hypothetical protein
MTGPRRIDGIQAAFKGPAAHHSGLSNILLTTAIFVIAKSPNRNEKLAFE